MISISINTIYWLVWLVLFILTFYYFFIRSNKNVIIDKENNTDNNVNNINNKNTINFQVYEAIINLIVRAENKLTELKEFNLLYINNINIVPSILDSNSYTDEDEIAYKEVTEFNRDENTIIMFLYYTEALEYFEASKNVLSENSIKVIELALKHIKDEMNKI